jgi:Arc/MetJ family transcription regulator
MNHPGAAGVTVAVCHTVCHTEPMRTTLDIDDDLLAALLARYPGSTKTEAIEAALRAHLTDDAIARLRRLAGTVDVEDVSRTIRTRDRRS